MNQPVVRPSSADPRPMTADAVVRAAVRSIVLVVVLLQVLAPWLHAHVSTARTVGFHVHLPHVAGVLPDRARADAAFATIAAADDGDAAVMPGGWLRGCAAADTGQPPDDAGHAAPPSACLRMPTAFLAVARLRIAQLDAPRPPPLAHGAHAARAPPGTDIGTDHG